MEAGRSRSRGRAGLLCLLAVLALGASPANVEAAHHHRPRPGTSCAHPLESGMATDGAGIGDTKDYSVTVKQVNSEPHEGTEPKPVRVSVTIHNPRVVLCSVEVDVIVSNPTTGIRKKYIYHPAISPNGGLSSIVEEPSVHLDEFGVSVYARYK
jgi:hypothetical protein